MEDLDPTTDTLVNRIPRPQIKRRGSRGSGSKSSGDGSERRERKRPKPTDLEEKFNKLDPSDPDQCKRIQQRKKDIAKGKNTAGYHAYTQQVPKEKRRIRSMDTPSTPNPTLDISKKRWQGLVRAWYVNESGNASCQILLTILLRASFLAGVSLSTSMTLPISLLHFKRVANRVLL